MGRQLSQNNRSQRIAAIQLHNDTYRQNLSLLASHTEVGIAGLNEFSNLDAPKQVEFGMIIQSLVRHIEQSYYLMKEGALKESTYNSAMSNASNITAYPGVKDWWITRREFFDAEFAGSLESYMKEHKSKGIYKILPNK